MNVYDRKIALLKAALEVATNPDQKKDLITRINQLKKEMKHEKARKRKKTQDIFGGGDQGSSM